MSDDTNKIKELIAAHLEGWNKPMTASIDHYLESGKVSGGLFKAIELMMHEYAGMKVTEEMEKMNVPSDEIIQAIGKVLEGFEKGIFVRSTQVDTDPSWAIKLLPYLRSLAVLQLFHDSQVNPINVLNEYNKEYWKNRALAAEYLMSPEAHILEPNYSKWVELKNNELK